MSYAVRNDKQGLRSVGSPDEVGDGEYYSEDLVELVPSEGQVIDAFRSVIQRHLDNAAVEAGYDDIRSAVTYADEPAVKRFQDEGRALRAWRSQVWLYGYEQLEAVHSGVREMPTAEQLVKELPKLTLPS